VLILSCICISEFLTTFVSQLLTLCQFVTWKCVLWLHLPSSAGKWRMLSLRLWCRFWEEKVLYTPESRLRVHEHMKAKREKQEKKRFVPCCLCYILCRIYVQFWWKTYLFCVFFVFMQFFEVLSFYYLYYFVCYSNHYDIVCRCLSLYNQVFFKYLVSGCSHIYIVRFFETLLYLRTRILKYLMHIMTNSLCFIVMTCLCFINFIKYHCW